MPEFNLRRVLVGLKAAQDQFRAHLRARLEAEGGAGKILRDLQGLAVTAREFEAEMRRFEAEARGR